MYEVSVDETFAAAHNLRGYKGKCEDLHGHNYKVRIVMAGKELDHVGLLYDFVHLKQVIRGVIASLDHKYLNELSPFDVIESIGRKYRAPHLRADFEADSRHAERRGSGKRHGVGDGNDGGDLPAVAGRAARDRTAKTRASLLWSSPRFSNPSRAKARAPGCRAFSCASRAAISAASGAIPRTRFTAARNIQHRRGARAGALARGRRRAAGHRSSKSRAASRCCSRRLPSWPQSSWLRATP